MTISHFPIVPYTNLRDDRPRHEISKKRLIQIVERATAVRQSITDDHLPICVMELLQFEVSNHCEWISDNSAFELSDGRKMDPAVEAFCDFHSGTEMYIREEVFEALFLESGQNDVVYHNAKQAIAHEAGHVLLKSHRRKIRARQRSASGSTSRRAAMDRRRPQGKINNSTSFFADLENEADLFGDAVQTPVMQLDGKLKVTEIAQLFDISIHSAKRAALLSKDYKRAKIVLGS